MRRRSSSPSISTNESRRIFVHLRALAVSLAATVLTAAPVVSAPTSTAPQRVSRTDKPAGKLSPFNNGKSANGATWFGATLGDGKYKGTGWPSVSDMQAMTSLGIQAVRLPIDPRYCLMPDGSLNRWVVSRLAQIIKFNMARGVSTVLDAHTYKPFNDPSVRGFWVQFAPIVERAIGGPSPFFGIELSNEPGRGSKDLVAWTEPLRGTIRTIRTAGYQGYIFAGAGDWNNATFLPAALAEVARTGGATAMDPFNRTIYTMHDYWNKDRDPSKTRNDRGAAVDGTIDFHKRYGPAISAARTLRVKIVMSEIGGGISPKGPLPAYRRIGKDGRQLEQAYLAYAAANRDVVIGTWWWMAGKTSSEYRHKVEAGNEHTKLLQGSWK